MEVIYTDGQFWISDNGKILEELGGFIDPITPRILIKEIEENGEI